MQLRTQQFFFSVVSLASLFSLSEAAHASLAFPNLPLPPRISANGYISDYTVGQADLMLPIQGDASHNLYIDPSIAYATDKQGYADLGLGYRWIRNNAAILGVYLFGGYSRIENYARLWVINPGIEALGRRWDARLNGYFPMGDRNYALGNLMRYRFTGHSEFIDSFPVSQHVGDGADVKLGYQLFPGIPLKGYLGSYVFAPAQTGSIWGGATGLEYWVSSNLKVFAGYTYDNLRHSTGALGLGVEFGGTHVHRSDPCLGERITDPVERYLGKLGLGSGIPSRIDTQLTPGASKLLFNNIAFFSPTGGPNNGGGNLTLANCTFENPCGPTDLTNASAITLASLLPNTMLYFNGGAYNALDVPGGTNAVTLQPGQSVFSRTPDYTQPATGAGRSIFNGAFTLSNNDSLNNIILLPTAATAPFTGVITSNAANFLITDSQIGSSTATFAVGLNNANPGIVNNSQIFANISGIYDNGGATLTLKNSVVTTVGIADSPLYVGIALNGPNSVVNLMNSQINVTAAPAFIGNQAVGILVPQPGSILTASNTTVNAINTESGGSSVALVSALAGATIQMTQGTLISTGTSPSIKAGNNITITSTTCILNGVPGPC
jgi:hypothetical protein